LALIAEGALDGEAVDALAGASLFADTQVTDVTK
jgi:hypothetical protein